MDHRPRVENADPTELTDPYPTWQEARRTCPVFYDERLGYWQITRYEDVNAAVLDTANLSSEGFFATVKVHPGNEHLLPHGPPGHGGLAMDTPSLATADPPTHTRVRKMCAEPFRPRRVADLEPELRKIADELIDGFAGDGHCDLIEQLSVPFSLLTIARILGMPDSDIDEMRRYSDEMPQTLDPSLTKKQQAELFRHYGTFYDFCREAAERARRSPGHDLLSGLVATIDASPADKQLCEAELVSVIATLITAGNETTRYLIGNMLLLLFRHPDQLEAVRADPSLATNAVEETLRHYTSVKGNLRIATSDVIYSGVTIPAGDAVQVCWGSAMRDESVFERPNEFDICRSDLKKHFSFSRGPHVCLGAPLARLESIIALQHLLARLPGLELEREPVYPDEYVSTVQVQGVARLDLRWPVVSK